MTKDDFKQLKVGDKFTFPLFGTALGGIDSEFEIAEIEAYNGEVHSITTTDGRRMKVDDAEVQRATLVKKVTLQLPDDEQITAMEDFFHTLLVDLETADEYDLGDWLTDYLLKHQGLPFSPQAIALGFRAMREMLNDK